MKNLTDLRLVNFLHEPPPNPVWTQNPLVSRNWDEILKTNFYMAPIFRLEYGGESFSFRNIYRCNILVFRFSENNIFVFQLISQI